VRDTRREEVSELWGGVRRRPDGVVGSAKHEPRV
jgi:hypothetical protein